MSWSTAHPTPASLAEQGQEPEPTSRPRPSLGRRRDKPQLSCSLCRRRKLRCDRQQPCSTCSSRGLVCMYTDNHASTPLSRPLPATLPNVHDRLVQLEQLVMALRSEGVSKGSLDPNSGENSGPETANCLSVVYSDPIQGGTPVDERSECGSIRVSASELSYVGGDHWAAILDGIAELKDHFDREDENNMAGHTSPALDGAEVSDTLHISLRARPGHSPLLYGCPQPSSRSSIIGALPPKEAVDRYISRYFNRVDLISCAVHGPTFLRQYEAFWANPSGTPIIWIGFLFSMIGLAVLISDDHDSGHGNEGDQYALQIELYREKIIQCLIMGEYTQAGPHVLETLIHYVYLEFLIRSDADRDVGYLNGVVVHTAMRMGYHRDPSHFPGITPFQAEMRRRMWATVLQGEILFAGQMGMPRIVSDGQCDTAEPRNLNDADLFEEAPDLPPPRPETEYTTVLGLIARRRMFLALGTITDFMASVKLGTHSEVMQLNSMLRTTEASIPPPLKVKPMGSSITDTPAVIMARLFIEHMLYKAQTMLHRRYLHAAPVRQGEDSHAYSQVACLNACLGTLQIQHVLDEETRPGGQLHMLRWRKTSIMNHQFLTATMILCSLLYRGQTLDREEDITMALRRARAIWLRGSSDSREAKKAAETVSIVLARASRGGEASPHPGLPGGEEFPFDVATERGWHWMSGF